MIKKILFIVLFIPSIMFGQSMCTDSVDCYEPIIKHYYKKSMVSIDSSIVDYSYDTINYISPFNKIIGIDVSIWQYYIDWNNIPSNYKFAFIKATGGMKTDVNFYYNWENCKLPKGAYHFFNPYINGEIQAKYFLSVVKLKTGDLPPVIDIEYTSYWRRCNKYTASKNLKLMLEYIENETGVKPIIYTNCNFWNKYVYPYIKFDPSNYLLWVANYVTKEYPCLPRGWDNWTFWQYTCRGNLFNKYCDLNYFKGDLKKYLIK